MIMSVEAFRLLRECWFNSKLRSQPHEREWEDEIQQTIREQYNSKLKMKYDLDTEAILRGEDRPICPGCAADLDWN